MKNNALTVKIVLTVVFVVASILSFIISLDYYSLSVIVQSGSLGKFIAYFLNFTLTTLLPILAVFSVIFVIYVKPLQKTANALKAGVSVDSALLEKAKSRMFRLPFITLALNFTGFVGGFILFAYTGGYLMEFFTIRVFSYFVFALAGSSIYSFIQISVHNQILADLRMLLKINTIGSKTKLNKIGLQWRTVLLAFALMVYGLSFFITKQLTFMESHSAYSSLLASVANGAITLERARDDYAAYLISKFGTFLNDKGHMRMLFDPDAQAAIFSGFKQFCVVSFGVMLSIGVTGTVIFSRELVMQIKFQNNTIESILDGRERIDTRINIIQFDEVGKLTSTLNLFMDKFMDIISEIGIGSDGVKNTSAKLDEDLCEASAAIQELVASIEQISRSAEGQLGIVKKVKGIAANTMENISLIVRNVADQADFVDETAAAMNEMAASTKSVNAITEKAETLSIDLIKVARDGEVSVDNVSEAIKLIETASNQVLGIVDILSNISTQTNLLSMNAAIEAAHAGESGKGFGIVAAEIRRLADDSRQQSEQIVSCIKDMMEKIGHGVEMTKGVRDSFSRIDKDVASTANLIKEISQAASEQRASASSILSSIGSVVKATEDVKCIAGGLKEESQEIDRAMESLLAVSAQINGATSEQIKGNEQIVSLISSVKDVSAQNLGIVRKLQSNILKFSGERKDSIPA
jgi:methyl-accepting chemotaxis protein